MSKRIPIILGFLLLMTAIWLQVTSIHAVRHFVTRQEYLAYDMQLRTKLFTHRKPLKTSVAIIDIDDKSLLEEGRWPWPRAKLATLVTRLQEQGAVVVAIDMLFPEKESNIATEVNQQIIKENLSTPLTLPIMRKIEPFFDNDAKFSNSLMRGDNVLGITFLPRVDIQGILPPPVLILKTPAEKQLGFIKRTGAIGNLAQLQTAAKHAGFINVFPDEDGIIRRVPLLIRHQDGLYPSLALEAVRLYRLNDIQLLTANYNNSLRIEGVKINNSVIPTDEEAQVIIPFQGKSYTFPYFSASDVLKKRIPQNSLAGKIVFVGTSATGVGDLKATAVQNIFPGIEVQATIADGILKNNFSYKPAWALGAEVVLTSVLGLLLVFIFPHLGPRVLSLLIVIIPVLLLIANNFLWDKTGLLISVFVPIALTVILAMSNIIYGYLFETRRRERLKEMFGQYVPATHIDEMLKTSGSYGLLGEDREMTVLFADIRNFTSISEPMSASKLKEMLNLFLTSMTEVIFKHRGTIDKYVGDLIMAFWGAPLKDKRHAQHAIETALDMQTKLSDVNALFAEHGFAPLEIGIGINSGVMSVGDMGSQFRRNYTVLGDAVNLGSRVEGLTKYYHAKIIVTENTQKNQKNFLFRQLDKVRVKGKKTSLDIFEVLCRMSDANID